MMVMRRHMLLEMENDNNFLHKTPKRHNQLHYILRKRSSEPNRTVVLV